MPYCYVFLTIFVLCGITLIECKDNSILETHYVVELNSNNFDESINTGNHFVNFYAPWCSHCQRLHPLWEQIAEIMSVKDEPQVVIAKVDCTQEQDLCAKYDITGYPTLRFFKLGIIESVKFKGPRDISALTEFINNQLNYTDHSVKNLNDSKSIDNSNKIGQLIELNEDNFAKVVSSGNHFVKFYAPWCGHCQRLAPTWDELAKTLDNHAVKANIARIDCTQYRQICQDFDVKSYPTLLWIEDGKKIEKYSGSRELDDLSKYVKKMLGMEIIQEDSNIDVHSIDDNDDDESKHQVIQLTSENFEISVLEGITFVQFYAPWCGYCQKLIPIWNQLAAKIHSSNNLKKKENNNYVKIAKVDCTVEENKKLCAEQQITSFPTLLIYKNGKRQHEYVDNRSLTEMTSYINKLMGHDEL